jgi:uncharacterized protein
VAVNGFPDTDQFTPTAVRDALALAPDAPVVRMDARSARSCLTTLVVLVEHALDRSVAIRS